MISHKHRCLFVHVPKTAGKSVLDLFGLPMLGIDYDKSMNWIEHPYGHMSVNKYKTREWFETYFKFAIVRNPFDRLVSSFHFLDKGGLNKGDKAFADEHLAQYEGDFRKFVAEGLQGATIYPHFRTQSEWVCNKQGNVEVDYIGHFENLNESIGKIADRIGLEYHGIKHLNNSVRGEWSQYYDEPTRREVEKVYASDFECFGYSTGIN